MIMNFVLLINAFSVHIVFFSWCFHLAHNHSSNYSHTMSCLTTLSSFKIDFGREGNICSIDLIRFYLINRFVCIGSSWCYCKLQTKGVELDPSRDAIGKIHAAAKNAVLKRKGHVAKEINLLGAAISGSSSSSYACVTPGSQVETCETGSVADHADNDEKTEGGGSSSEDELTTAGGTGFTSLIKAFVPTEKPSNPKAAAKPKAKSSPKAVATPKPSATKTAPTRTSAKIAVGNVGKRRKVVVEDLGNIMDADLSSELQEQDLSLLSDFKERLQTLKKLEPPVADSPFKTYLNDVCQSVTALKGELKTKRRSALRRADKDQDPLYIHLGEVQADADQYLHMLKCFLISIVKGQSHLHVLKFEM